MKKNNKLLIITIILALHALAAAFIFLSKDKAEPSRPSYPRTESRDRPFEVEKPQDLPPKPARFSSPFSAFAGLEDSPSTPSGSSAGVIATPVNKVGFLRSDRPINRTSQSYSKLVGQPYRGAIVVDARTGKILYEDHATNHAYPASVTKLMTLLLVLEEIDSGKISLNEKVTITREGMRVGGSQAYLDVRESGLYSVDDLLKALMIHSANDAAAVLAIRVAGTQDAFVEKMNQKARQLGMNSTTYHSVHGLPPSDGSQPDISTPYDIALLSLAVLRHPQTLGYTSNKLDYFPPSPQRPEGPFMMATRNVLIKGGSDGYDGCDGLKTGYHARGGWSLSATAEKNGKRVIAIALGCPDKKSRNATVCSLLDKGFAQMNE